MVLSNIYDGGPDPMACFPSIYALASSLTPRALPDVLLCKYNNSQQVVVKRETLI